VVVTLLLVAAVGGVALAVVEAGEDETAGPLAATTTEPPPATAADAFVAAATALEAASGFSYEFDGTWELQPEGGEREVLTETGNGHVRLPDDAQHSVTADDGSRRDLMILGGQVWRRGSAFPDQVEERPWAQAGRLGVDGVAAFDPRAVVAWLRDATEHRDGGEDAEGHAVVHGVLPPQALPPSALDLSSDEEETLTGEIELTLDVDQPVKVALNATTTSAVVELVLTSIDLAVGPELARPTGDQIDPTPYLDQEDIAAVQGTETIGLAGIPEGWFLISAYVTPDPNGPECAEVNLDYAGLGGTFDAASGPANFLYLAIVPESCDSFPTPVDPTFTAGGYEGFAEETEEATVGSLALEDRVVIFASSLSVTDLEVVLGTIQSVDLAVQPDEIEGIPADPA
jgi:hypothetical protein